ncbi:MAG: hypothetical protein H0V26_01535 [Solirubrobacterales bacterium]|nr:hypothetical protein [Solirubrobacterales bacterium]
MAAALAVALVTSSEEGDRPAARAPVTPGLEAAPGANAGDPQTQETDGDLAIGITEPNANFVWPPRGRPLVEPFARWRTAFDRVRPAYYRLVLDWASLQPSEDAPARLDQPNGGCMRDILPCNGWAGVRDQLRAVAARQKETGMQVLTVLTGSPAWAARPAGGCERGGTDARSRPPRTSALPAYRRLVADALAVAAQEGAELRYWSPWNEPNHPYFLSPQRTRCSDRAPTAAVAPYAEMAGALKAELEAAPGEQEYLLGELSAFDRPKPRNTAVEEFARALPDDLVCGARAWAQHAYVGGSDPVDPAAIGLAAHNCLRSPEIWITETGVGAPRRDLERATDVTAERSACRAMHEQLIRWYEDPRVTVAFQYTLREDDRFATGLVNVSLTRAYPVLRTWQAWGGRRATRDPAPRVDCS